MLFYYIFNILVIMLEDSILFESSILAESSLS